MTEEQKVKVRIKPLKGIGGIGNAGDVVTMDPADAEMYFRDGYIEYVEETPSVDIPSPAAPLEEAVDHEIMKPQPRRSRKK